MAWAPIILALALAVGLAPLRRVFSLFNLFDADDATVAAFVLAGARRLCGMGRRPRTPGGDEPHYLVITQSILHDRDLNIDTHTRFARLVVLSRPHRSGPAQARASWRAYSIHAPAVCLVAPMFQFSATRARG